MTTPRTQLSGTIMGSSPECEHCQRLVHAKGMIGGGWRVDGVGGHVLTLTIKTHPPECASTTIIVDRAGRVVEVRAA